MNKFFVRFLLVTTISGSLNWFIGHNLPERHGPRYYVFASQTSLGIALILSEGIISISSLVLNISKTTNKTTNKPTLRGRLEQELKDLPAGHPDTFKVIELLASLSPESDSSTAL
jgi:hypothetical protein